MLENRIAKFAVQYARHVIDELIGEGLVEFKQMAQAATRLLGADRASIFLWDRPNHVLVAAKTGEMDEYASLRNAEISPAVVEPLTAWLTRTFAAVR